MFAPVAASLRHFSPVLRRGVFVGEAALGAGFDPRIGGLGIADHAGLVNLFVGQADVGRAYRFRFGSGAFVCIPNLPPFLRGVVLVGEAALGAGFDLQRVGLGAVGRGVGPVT